MTVCLIRRKADNQQRKRGYGEINVKLTSALVRQCRMASSTGQ
jgi:hypothetical protein